VATLGALTLREQRLVSAVLVGALVADPSSTGAAPAGDPRAAAAREVERWGGRLDVLADGAMVATMVGAGSAVDRAIRACRCALGLRDRLGPVGLSVVTGRGVVSARSVEGSVIDRGAEALAAAAPGTIRVDAATAEMVEQRFGVDPEGDAFILRGERGQPAPPLLLGKPSAFVGRSRELALLESVLSGCIEERAAGAVVVTGEAGTGKSRLAAELLARVRRGAEPATVLVGHAGLVGDGAPFGVLADAIRDAAGILAGAPAPARRDALTARLGRLLGGPDLARVSAFLGEMSGTPFPDEHAPALRAARGNAQILGDAMRAAWEEWLAAEAADGPVILVLEDLHLADAATVRLVDATLKNLRDLPLFVLALARPEIHARFLSLWAGRGVQELRLGPLARRASDALVRNALGRDADDDVVARVLDRADSNPFYLEELVRAVAAGREAFPSSVLGTVEARLDAEGAEGKRILRAASVFGDRFSARGLEALLGGDPPPDEARAWLDGFAARELISPPAASARPGDALYTFGHALVREAAYATLTDADRALGHRLAGRWLEASGEADAAALADHFLKGGEPLAAVRWFRRGAQQALAADDLAAAIEGASRGVACGAVGEELGALLLVSAEAHLWRGDLLARAEEQAMEASRHFPPGSEGFFRGLYQAVVAAGKLGHVELIERCCAAAATPADPGAEGARVSYLCACASSLVLDGHYAAAAAAFAALDALEALGPPDALSAALIHQSRSFSAAARGDDVGCLEGLRAARGAFEEAGDRRNACSTQVNLGFIQGALGELPQAEEALRVALATAERMGLGDLAAVARNNLGNVLGSGRRFDEARRCLLPSIEAFSRQGASREEGLARIYLAGVELCAGDAAAAEREARAAASVLTAMPPLRAYAVALLARAWLQEGRPAEALEAAGEAYAMLVSLGSIEEGEATVRLVHAEALAAAGHAAAHRDAVVEARARLLARADRITDAALRARFLANVPDNARTLALTAALGIP
jgi:tetratricopeptide (TPR) repeat protein